MSEALISCPLCGLPHRAVARRCDNCKQPLHEPLAPVALADELSKTRRNIWLSVAIAVALLAVNAWLFETVGGFVRGFVMFIVPVGFIVVHWNRFSALKRHLRNT